MDERVARLRTSQEARVFAANALRLGHLHLADEARQRAIELKATEDGYLSPAQRAIASALYAYEDQQTRLKGRKFRAIRTRQMFERHGVLAAAERMVLNNSPSKGYEVLEDAGLQELSFEAIIIRFPKEFSAKAIDASQARLQGRPRLADDSHSAVASGDVGGDNRWPGIEAWDSEALAFVEGFRDPRAWFLATWMPRYRETIGVIADSLAAGKPEDLFDLIWKRQDNHISHAGSGLASHRDIDKLRDELTQVIVDVQHDGSADSFERIVRRVEGWRSSQRLEKTPRLLIARAFAGIHPSHYHTTVDSKSQKNALAWFAEHTGMVVRGSANWALHARTLTAHLDRSGLFEGQPLSRNMFPWFVVDQLRARSMSTERPPGHHPRPHWAFAELPPGQRSIELRHNAVQTALFSQLAAEYGPSNVWTEYPTGTGGYADALVRRKDGGRQLYEIKIAASASAVVRQAMGQLLEYGYRRGGLEPKELFIVGEHPLDESTRAFLDRLRIDFNLEIDYLHIEPD